jgi:carbon monoxide dehydrogenase subunit G
MKVEGSFKLKSTMQKAWDVMLKGDTLASCVPGAEKIETKDNKTYNCIVKQSVGPISVKVQLVVELTEMNPPTHLKAVGRGEALGKLGTFSLDLTVNLKEISKDEIEVFYNSDANIVGKLATFGERIMRAKINSVVEQFTKNLQAKLAAGV